ncbi:MAG: hypothetical protein ACYCOU_25385 [Sulfobacillus sp.]
MRTIAPDAREQGQSSAVISAAAASPDSSKTAPQGAEPEPVMLEGVNAASAGVFVCFVLPENVCRAENKAALSLDPSGDGLKSERPEQADAPPKDPNLVATFAAQDKLTLVFHACAPLQSTEGYSFPKEASAATLDHSSFKYVSRLDYTDKEDKQLHFRIGRELKCVLRGHKETTIGRVGAIAVHERPPDKADNNTRLDVAIVFVGDTKTWGPKPSYFLPESKQPPSSEPSAEQSSTLISKTRAWVFENHVKRAEAREKTKKEMEAYRRERSERKLRSQGQSGDGGPGSGSPKTPADEPPSELPPQLSLDQFRSSLTEALSPLAASISALTASALHPTSSSSAAAAGQTPALSSSTALVPWQSPSPAQVLSSPADLLRMPASSFSVAQAPHLAAALAHSQIGAMHLLAAALSASGQPQPQANQPLLLLPPQQTAPGAGVAQAADTEQPRGRKRRRKGN